MTRPPRTTLEQWAVLHAIQDHGSFDAAAEALSRSQSSVSYAMRQLEAQLPVALFTRSGRSAVLTDAGRTLATRSRALMDETHALERFAETLASGWPGEIALAADIVCPPGLVMAALARFAARAPRTRVRVLETVLSGTVEAIANGDAAVAVVGGQTPPGYTGEPLLDVDFIAVARPDHPLHDQGRPLTDADLRKHCQIVIADTGRQDRDSGWLGAERRLTVAHPGTSVTALEAGLGFAWVPRHTVADALEADRLRPLELETGQVRRTHLNI